MELFQTRDLAFGGLIRYGDLSIPSGRVTFVTGESGSGKSTLFKLMNGVLSPSQGKIFFRGQDVQNLDPVAHRREVTLVAQEPYLFSGSIRGNFDAYYAYRELPAPYDNEIQTLLNSFLLNFDPTSATQTLSGGEKQRVYLAIFLSFRPKVLLLDEPTSALDHVTGETVLKNTIRFCKENGSELIAISHNKDLAAKFSENTLNLERRNGS